MTTPLRLGGVPEHFNLPWHLALESGALGDIQATWEDQYGGTGQMLAGLENGELDLVSILTEGTVAAIAGGLPVTIVQVYVASPLQWGIHVPAESDLHDVAQLEGGRIAISRFRSGSHLMAFVQADRRGWALTDDQFVTVGDLEGARECFAEAGAEQFLWDRFMTQPLVDAGEFRRIGIETTPWPSFVIAARNEVLLERTAEVGAVVDEVVARASGLHELPGVVDLLAERYGISRTAADEWLASTTFAPRSAFDPEIAAATLATLRRAGFAD